jgi:hypothetical protein
MQPLVGVQALGQAAGCSALVAVLHSRQPQRAMLACSPVSVPESPSPPELFAVQVQLVSQRSLALVLAWLVLVPVPQPVALEPQRELPACPVHLCAKAHVRHAAFLWPAQC